ncbi:hypothetical protein ACS0TY_028705 [Phlomoides rotata]
MRLSVNNYHEISFGTLPISTILIDPPISQAKNLDSWLKANREYVERIVPQKLYEKENQITNRPLDSQIRKISQILCLPETSHVKSFWIKSTLQVIKPGQQFYFLGCPGCSKACGAVYGSEFTCFYCNTDFPNPKPMLRFEDELYDGTGCLDAFAEHTEAQTLLHMSAEDVITAAKENQMGLDEVNERFKDLLFFFHIRTSNTEIRRKKYIRNTIMTCLPASEQPSTSQISHETDSFLNTQKRLMSDVSMSESQQSTSTVQEGTPLRILQIVQLVKKI